MQCSFTITSTHTSNDDLLRDWAEIRKVTTELLEDLDIHISDRVRVQLKGTSHILHSITMCISAFCSSYGTRSASLSHIPLVFDHRHYSLYLLWRSFDIRQIFPISRRYKREERSIWLEFVACQLANVTENCEWIVCCDFRFWWISWEILCRHSNSGKTKLFANSCSIQEIALSSVLFQYRVRIRQLCVVGFEEF